MEEVNDLLHRYYQWATPIGDSIILWARPEGWAVSPTSVSIFLFI